MSANNAYTTGNFLDLEFFSNNYKIIAIYISKQIESQDSDTMKKLILLADLKEIKEEKYFSSLRKQKKKLLIFRKIL